MGESGYEAYLVPKRGEYIRRSLGGMSPRNSASLCTGTVPCTLCPVCRRASQLHVGSYLCISAPKSWVGRAAAPKICRSSWHAAGLEPGLAHASHGLPSPPACTPAPCRSAPVNMKEMTRSTVAESIPLSHQHESTPPTQRTPYDESDHAWRQCVATPGGERGGERPFRDSTVLQFQSKKTVLTPA